MNIGSGKPRRVKNVIEKSSKNFKGWISPIRKLFKLRKFDMPKLYPNIEQS